MARIALTLLLLACSGPGEAPATAEVAPPVETVITHAPGLEAAGPEVSLQGTVRVGYRNPGTWGAEVRVLELEDGLVVLEGPEAALGESVLKGRLVPVSRADSLVHDVEGEVSAELAHRPLLALRDVEPVVGGATGLRTAHEVKTALGATPVVVEGTLVQTLEEGVPTGFGLNLEGTLLTVMVVAEVMKDTEALVGQRVRARGQLRVDTERPEVVTLSSGEATQVVPYVFLAQPKLDPVK